MITKVEVYSSSQIAAELSFNENGFIEDDLIQITNIDGLDPVKASIDVVSSGNVDGAIALDSQVPTRNIVITLHPNPDWATWTSEALRKIIYSYFMPKSNIKLIFNSDEMSPVEIFGTVESCEANPFSKDPEYNVSIICPDPYFTTVDPILVSGTVIAPENWAASNTTIHLYGSIPIGIEVTVPDGVSGEVYIQAGNPGRSTFHVVGAVSGIFEMNSVPLHKYVRRINSSNGAFENLLAKLQLGSTWPVLNPGDNPFAVMGASPMVGNDWHLKYYEKYGGL